jgi:thiamine biosynthesis protein ThiI
VTGDSLGQVASQTAENLRTIHAVADRPVFSPLIGDDKRDVVALARRIGTFDISIRPHEDCCSFLIAAHPATRTTPEQLAREEEGLPWDELVAEAVAGIRREVYRASDGPG